MARKIFMGTGRTDTYKLALKSFHLLWILVSTIGRDRMRGDTIQPFVDELARQLRCSVGYCPLLSRLHVISSMIFKCQKPIPRHCMKLYRNYHNICYIESSRKPGKTTSLLCACKFFFSLKHTGKFLLSEVFGYIDNRCQTPSPVKTIHRQQVVYFSSAHWRTKKQCWP